MSAVAKEIEQAKPDAAQIAKAQQILRSIGRLGGAIYRARARPITLGELMDGSWAAHCAIGFEIVEQGREALQILLDAAGGNEDSVVEDMEHAPIPLWSWLDALDALERQAVPMQKALNDYLMQLAEAQRASEPQGQRRAQERLRVASAASQRRAAAERLRVASAAADAARLELEEAAEHADKIAKKVKK